MGQDGIRNTLICWDKRTQISFDLIAKINLEDSEARLIVGDVSSSHYPLQPPWRVPGLLWPRSAKVLGIFDALGVEYVDCAKMQPIQTDFTAEESHKMGIAIRSTIMNFYAKGIRLRTRPQQQNGASVHLGSAPFPDR